MSKGHIPPANSGVCGVVVGDHLYVFGGISLQSFFSNLNYGNNFIIKATLEILTLRVTVTTFTSLIFCPGYGQS